MISYVSAVGGGQRRCSLLEQSALCFSNDFPFCDPNEMSGVITSVSLVLVGQFDPDNFFPEKLAKGKVIGQKAADSASYIALMPTQTVHFKIGWAEIVVAQNRLQVISLEPPHIRICDFVLKALGELAPSSTISQFGINVDCHYDLGSVDARNNFGRRIAPPEMWGAWGHSLLESMTTGEHKGTYLQGGVVNVQMRQPFSEGGLNGWLNVAVGPSQDIPNHCGILFRSNHHHQVASIDPAADESAKQMSDGEATALLLAALSSGFDKSLDDAFSIFEGVISSS